LRFRGRLDEAEAEIKKAKELDPLSLVIDSCVGDMFYLKREYDQAIRRYRETFELDPNFSGARLYMGKCYRQKRMFEEAIVEFQKAREGSENAPYGLAELGNVFALSGRNQSNRVLTNLSDCQSKYSVNYGTVIYCSLVMRRAFEWLGKGL
jgi:tetratricopeptide (TPR) repeat protein